MPFCATCGAQVEGRFCGKCGSTVAAGSAPAGSAPPGPGPQPMAVAAPMAENVASALCYVLGLVTGIIFLVLAPYNQNKTVRFHAFQSIFFHVACILFYFVFSIVLGIFLSMLHIFGLGFLVQLVGLLFFVAWLYLLISAYQGKTVVLPIIGPIAQKQA
jgi:uncharacterized membrane protein